MGKAARLRAQKAQQHDPRTTPWSRPRPGENIEVAFLPGCTIHESGAIEDMQRQTHDGVLRMVGNRRRSGIRWQHVHGRAECERVLRELYDDEPALLAEIEGAYFPFLAEHGDNAVMIVAMCDAVVPR